MFSSLLALGKRKNARNKSSRSTKRFKSLASRHLGIENLERRELLTICTWTGNSQTSNDWTDSYNWDVKPIAGQGDQLIFSGTTRTNPNYDFPSGSSFDGIKFRFDNYRQHFHA